MKSVLNRLLTFLVVQGAFQELKLYGSPTQAEVQCVNTFEVSCFNLFIFYDSVSSLGKDGQHQKLSNEVKNISAQHN